MDRNNAAKQIMELFIKAARQYHALEKLPSRTKGKHGLFHSERHMLDLVGDHPDINITEFARAAGITKGAVSQVVKKLETKGFVRRYKRNSNDKEVLIELTKTGREAYEQHRRKNEETIVPLLDALKNHSDDKVEFLITMLSWISDHLEQGSRSKKDRS